MHLRNKWKSNKQSNNSFNLDTFTKLKNLHEWRWLRRGFWLIEALKCLIENILQRDLVKYSSK